MQMPKEELRITCSLFIQIKPLNFGVTIVFSSKSNSVWHIVNHNKYKRMDK